MSKDPFMLMPFDALITEAKRLKEENNTLRAQLAASQESPSKALAALKLGDVLLTNMSSQIKQLKEENETLRAQLAAIMEPLSDAEIIKLTQEFTDDRNYDYYTVFADVIHSAILARIDNNKGEQQ